MPDFTSLIASIISRITSKTDPNTISPEDVGDSIVDTINAINTYLNAQAISSIPTGTPTGGNDGDIVVVNNNPPEIWQRVGGTWAQVGTINDGLPFPDGNYTVKTILQNPTLTAFAGFWFLDAQLYQTTAQTQFTISSPDATQETQDLIYAKNDNTIYIEYGTPGAGQPALPADSVYIDTAIIPSTASGAQPYLLIGNVQGAVSTIAKVIVIGTADGNGEYTVTASIPSDCSVSVYDTSGLPSNSYSVPASYDEITKLLYGLNPSSTFKAIFIG